MWLARSPLKSQEPYEAWTVASMSCLVEAQEIFEHPYYLDQRSDIPEQYRAIGWVEERLYAHIFEMREDRDGEYYHLVTLWKATKQEQKHYEENS
jgi:hypothetical protein